MLYDGVTGVMVVTAEPDVELVVEEKNTGNIVVEINGVIVSAYDISLQRDGETVQHEDPVKVRIPFVGEYDEDFKVYRVEADGTLTYMNAEYFDGDLLFSTDHFSLYIVAHKERLLGDVDGDGDVEVRDATFIQRYVASIDIPFMIDKATADVDGDDEIAVIDATFIQRYAAQIDIPYAIGEPV